MAKMYSCTAIKAAVDFYMENDGVLYEIEEGTLGYGLSVLLSPKYYSIIIREKYLNEWSSGHTIRQYEYLPYKYYKMILDKFPNDKGYLDGVKHIEQLTVKPKFA